MKHWFGICRNFSFVNTAIAEELKGTNYRNQIWYISWSVILYITIVCIRSKLLYSWRSQKDKVRFHCREVEVIWCYCSLYKVSIMGLDAFHKACCCHRFKIKFRMMATTIYLHLQVSFMNPFQKQWIECTISKTIVTAITKTIFVERMSAPTPVAIGTRGTIGSLVRKEIEYFSKFELGNSQRPQPHYVDMVSSRGYSSCRPSFWVFLMTGKRRKRRGSNVFVPKMCSVAEVVENSKWNRVPGYGYRILKDDINNFHLWVNLNLLSWIALCLYLEWPKTWTKLMLFSLSVAKYSLH